MIWWSKHRCAGSQTSRFRRRSVTRFGALEIVNVVCGAEGRQPLFCHASEPRVKERWVVARADAVELAVENQERSARALDGCVVHLFHSHHLCERCHWSSEWAPVCFSVRLAQSSALPAFAKQLSMFLLFLDMQALREFLSVLSAFYCEPHQ